MDFDLKIAALGPAQLLQALPQGGSLPSWAVALPIDQNSDAPNSFRGLGKRTDWPNKRAPQQSQALPASHVYVHGGAPAIIMRYTRSYHQRTAHWRIFAL